VKKRRLYHRLVNICTEALLLDDDYDDSDNEDGDEIDDLLEITYELGQSISRTLESTVGLDGIVGTGRQNNRRNADPPIPTVRRGKAGDAVAQEFRQRRPVRGVAKGSGDPFGRRRGAPTVASLYTSECVIEGNDLKKT
jgi:hypothetical protein